MKKYAYQENKESDMKKLDKNIVSLFKRAFRMFSNKPGHIFFLLRTIFKQKKAVRKRSKWAAEGIHVPPFMILSITDRCNLKCRGCYASVHSRNSGKEMSEDTLRKILSEAVELGISIVLVAGGEPFTKKEIIEIFHDYPEIIFPVFTNGLLLESGVIEKLKNNKNIVPIISLEGKRRETDTRRGEGVYKQLQKTLKELGQVGIINGISFTLTEDNFSTVTNRDFITSLINNGSKIFFFVEYVPIEEGTESLIITEQQRLELKKILERYRSELSGLFISFPGDEEEFGGCLAAGRGFIHVNANGNIEPCPFAPYSDINLKGLSLREGLESNLLMKIRTNQDILKESEAGGGCTLWSKRELVKSLLEEGIEGGTKNS